MFFVYLASGDWFITLVRLDGVQSFETKLSRSFGWLDYCFLSIACKKQLSKEIPASARQRNFHLNSIAGIKNLHVVEWQALANGRLSKIRFFRQSRRLSSFFLLCSVRCKIKIKMMEHPLTRTNSSRYPASLFLVKFMQRSFFPVPGFSSIGRWLVYESLALRPRLWWSESFLFPDMIDPPAFRPTTLTIQKAYYVPRHSKLCCQRGSPLYTNMRCPKNLHLATIGSNTNFTFWQKGKFISKATREKNSKIWIHLHLHVIWFMMCTVRGRADITRINGIHWQGAKQR